MPQVDASPAVLAYDLGTSGLKAAVVGAGGRIFAESLRIYDTFFPETAWHEQRPGDWWAALVKATADVLAECPVDSQSIRAIALSGHSLGCIPLDRHGALLQDQVPIWSDGRAAGEVAEFFSTYAERDWYERTGNGFPPALYPLFKLRWLRKHKPETLDRAAILLGTKDYINFRLTGRLAPYDLSENLLRNKGGIVRFFVLHAGKRSGLAQTGVALFMTETRKFYFPSIFERSIRIFVPTMSFFAEGGRAGSSLAEGDRAAARSGLEAAWLALAGWSCRRDGR